ncbi:hypothetical protein Patl1_27479 [Pistacia atlantica]|uniref:Uncharacterized protein n=1 Tax=Pistacia atlantica TaxID=434234 RepID=A0ACC1BBI1_9ROSI|nr:hypothetical protein Patl1_27479 [Pistacia atlantica]
MDTPAPSPPSPSSPQHRPSTAPVSAETPPNPLPSDPNPTACNSASSSKPLNRGKNKKKRLNKDVPSSSSCSLCSTSKGKGLAFRRRNVKFRAGQVRRPSEGTEIEAIALPLGMSFAAVVAQLKGKRMRNTFNVKVMVNSTHYKSALNFQASTACDEKVVIKDRRRASGAFDLHNLLCFREANVELALALAFILESCCGAKLKVLERKDAAGDRISIDHLSRICTSAVRESLTNIKVLKYYVCVHCFDCLIGNSNSELHDCHSETDLPTIATEDTLTTPEVEPEQTTASFIYKELVLHDQNNQLACASSSSLDSAINKNVLSTMEKSVIEQVRSNDLKALELGLVMKKLKLKEAQLALNHDSNHLERSKLAVGISKASFKAEKFKNQLEDMRHGELLKKCIDCLVAGIVLMSGFPFLMPLMFFHTKRFLKLLQPVHLYKSLLASPAFGHFKTDNAYHFYPFALGSCLWFCRQALHRHSGWKWILLAHMLGDSLLAAFLRKCLYITIFIILHGPVEISQGMKGKTVVPYWARRSVFYATLLLFLPLICGLMPFATLNEWKDHFSVLILDPQSSSIDD